MSKEFLIIMKEESTHEQFQNVIDTIQQENNKVILQQAPKLILGNGTNSFIDSLNKEKGLYEIFTEEVQDIKSFKLNQNEELTVNAWNSRQKPAFMSAKAERPQEGESWGFSTGCNKPIHNDNELNAFEAAQASASQHMTGLVGVGVIIVDGPTGSSAAFTPEERNKVITEVQEGTSILANLAPVNTRLNFTFDIRTVKIDINPNQIRNNFEDESKWRDAAMNKLGYPSDLAGMNKYIEDLRTTILNPVKPDWGYIAFFIKYPAGHFAYATLGGPRLVMQYQNDGWGPDNIDRVFAHETGHIFGAPDEYAQSGCRIGGQWGQLKVPNNNCEAENSNAVPCLMLGNTSSVCKWTAGHFGWWDTDGDNIPDVMERN